MSNWREERIGGEALARRSKVLMGSTWGEEGPKAWVLGLTRAGVRVAYLPLLAVLYKECVYIPRIN